jgi:hypothetical protein
MPEDAGPTKRVLLKRERVIVLPEGVATVGAAEDGGRQAGHER